MGICAEELRLYVVRPTLKHLGYIGEFTENLLLGTAAVESGLGFHIKQQQERAFGIYRITALMHRMVWDRYLVKRPDLASSIRGLASQHEFLEHPHAELATNLSYSTAIACMIYVRAGCELTIPDNNIETMARYWRRHYHPRPKGSLQDYIEAYQQLIPGSPQAA